MAFGFICVWFFGRKIGILLDCLYARKKGEKMPFDDDLTPLDNPPDTPDLDTVLASFDDTPLEALLADMMGHDELLANFDDELLAIGKHDELLAIGNVELAGNADLSEILASWDDTPL